MAGQSRTLKLALLADVANFTKDLGKAGNSTKTLGDQASEFGKKAALAFAAAGAAIGAFAVASVKAAAEDEAGQRKLEETIRNTTNATAEQIAGIDKYVTAQSIATATTDDVIRPALSRLLRSTGDLTKAQELLTLSQEIAAATGKPLEAVTNAVAKSFDGSNTALTKLGIGIDAATLKTLTFDETQTLLNKTFDGFIENQSTTAAFKFQQLSIAIGETKEQVGAALLPAITALTDYILVNVVPVVQSFVDGLTGANGLDEGLTKSQKTAIEWGKKVKGLIETVIAFKDELLIVAGIIGTIFVANKIAAGVQATIALIKLMTAAYAALRNTALAAAIAARFAANPLLGLASAAAIAAAIYGATKIFDNADAAGNAPSTGSIPFASGFAPAISSGDLPGYIEVKDGNLVNTLSGQIVGKAKGVAGAVQSANIVTNAFNAGTFKKAESSDSGTIINVTVNGAIDKEGTARTIVDTLNNSFYRGTGGATALQTA
jgi:hypothetical protein